MYIKSISEGMGTWTEGENRRFLSYLVSPYLDPSFKNISIGVVALPPCTVPVAHLHEEADEYWYVIEGNGKMQIGSETMPIKQGDVIFGPRRLEHRIINDRYDSMLKALFILTKSGDEKNVVEKIRNEGIQLL